MRGSPYASTPKALSELNQSRIVQYLHQHGTSSRAQMARDINLTPAAVGKLVGRLIDLGLISETGSMDSEGGRRSIGLALNADRYQVIGVKFARSLVSIGLFDISGRLLDSEELPPVNPDDIPGAVAEVRTRVEARLEAHPAIVAVGMAVPGPYLRDTGRIALVTSMPGWRGVDFIHEFGRAFRVPTFIEQDARAGALAQSLFDPGVSASSMAYFLVGEGVGLGVIDRGALVDGSRGAATEIGHVSIDLNGLPCECGNRGCLECYCSAVAIHRRMRQPDMRDHFPGIEAMTHAKACAVLFHQARSGQQTAQTLVDQIADYVGYGCVTIVNAYNPAQIVIGDMVAAAGTRLLERVRAIVSQRALPGLREHTQILLSNLPADATLTGAAAVAASQFLEHPASMGRPAVKSTSTRRTHRPSSGKEHHDQ